MSVMNINKINYFKTLFIHFYWNDSLIQISKKVSDYLRISILLTINIVHEEKRELY